jgi:hypothetical protein
VLDRCLLRSFRTASARQRELLAPELPPGNVADGLGWLGFRAGAAGAIVPELAPAPMLADPGAAVSGVTVLGVAATGGPASVCCPGGGGDGMSGLPGELAGLGALPAVPGGVTVSVGLCGAGAGGVTSFLSVALAPNGLRESSELCANSAPVHGGCCSAARGSAILTSAGSARSTAAASFTTTGCMNSMAHPPRLRVTTQADAEPEVGYP